MSEGLQAQSAIVGNKSVGAADELHAEIGRVEDLVSNIRDATSTLYDRLYGSRPETETTAAVEAPNNSGVLATASARLKIVKTKLVELDDLLGAMDAKL